MVDDQEEVSPETEEELKIKKIKQMNRVVCICKGIKLASVLKGLGGSSCVEDVNKKVGTGSGGCSGERCGPRIKILLRKNEEAKNKN